jgi:hypothetical protein
VASAVLFLWQPIGGMYICVVVAACQHSPVLRDLRARLHCSVASSSCSVLWCLDLLLS